MTIFYKPTLKIEKAKKRRKIKTAVYYMGLAGLIAAGAVGFNFEHKRDMDLREKIRNPVRIEEIIVKPYYEDINMSTLDGIAYKCAKGLPMHPIRDYIKEINKDIDFEKDNLKPWDIVKVPFYENTEILKFSDYLKNLFRGNKK